MCKTRSLSVTAGRALDPDERATPPPSRPSREVPRGLCVASEKTVSSHSVLGAEVFPIRKKVPSGCFERMVHMMPMPTMTLVDLKMWDMLGMEITSTNPYGLRKGLYSGSA